MYKRILFLLPLLAFITAGALAEELTEKEAMKLAQEFVSSHNTRKSSPTVEAAGQVSGLYVFNVSNDGGFVIVSNDDSAAPILGFSQSGNIDISDLPDNMRAWLQGYADQIAWQQQHGAQSAEITPNKAPRREAEAPETSDWTPGNAKTAIEPLVPSRWNQGEPYNDQTPYYKKESSGYSYSREYSEGYTHCATGCVATAMAQVMYFHKWPTSATATIPAYQWKTNYWLPVDSKTALESTTFDWTNMINEYDPKVNGKRTIAGTEVQKQAVAKLMKYCGYAVKMNYGPESSSYTSMVATALKTYFDYNTTTTKFVSRSYYSYANWMDLIYYELAHGRPVVYGGQSSGGGHEFVCDGYKYDGGDLFHINWGWGSTCDGYFLLSALNPVEQGIGGSSSDDGFHYGQDAVIGIQPSTSTGTLSSITANNVSLTANSMTLSNNTIALGKTVTVTINVTNNSSTDSYDGDVWIGRKIMVGNKANYTLLNGNTFVIPANGSHDCDLTFSPYATGTYNLVAFFPNDHGTYSTDERILATLKVVDVALTDNSTDNSTIVDNNDDKTVSVSLTNRTLYKDGEWNTLCLPFDVTDSDANDGLTFTGTPLQGATVMQLDTSSGNYAHATGFDGNTLYLNFSVVDEIVAGTPYIIKWGDKSDQSSLVGLTDISSPIFDGVTIDKTMHNVAFPGGVFKGIYDSRTFTANDQSVLFLGSNSTLYWPQSGVTIGAQRAYFQLSGITAGQPSDPNTPHVRAFSLNFFDEQSGTDGLGDDYATAILSIDKADIHDASPSEWFTLDGRRLNAKPTQRGIYINNGIKRVIK